MNSFALGMAILAGCGEAADQIQEQRVLDGCFATLFPQDEWLVEVDTVRVREKADPDATRHVMGDYYRTDLRREVTAYLKQRWGYEEQLFLCSDGKLGKAPQPWQRLNLAELVRAIGRRIPLLLMTRWEKA